MKRETQIPPGLNGSLPRIEVGQFLGMTAKCGPSHGTSCSQNSEAAARATLESIAARPLSDTEWERVSSRLLEFVTILRDWDQKAEVPETCRTDNVVKRRAKIGESVEKVA